MFDARPYRGNPPIQKIEKIRIQNNPIDNAKAYRIRSMSLGEMRVIPDQDDRRTHAENAAEHGEQT